VVVAVDQSGDYPADRISVPINVIPVNDAPTSTTVTLSIPEASGAQVITQAALLANARDVDTASANLIAQNLTLNPSTAGTLVAQGSDWLFTPNGNAPASFTYTISDGVLSTTATMAVNRIPVALTERIEVNERSDTNPEDGITGSSNIITGALQARDVDSGNVLTFSQAPAQPSVINPIGGAVLDSMKSVVLSN
jgi:hypothetical protein